MKEIPGFFRAIRMRKVANGKYEGVACKFFPESRFTFFSSLFWDFQEGWFRNNNPKDKIWFAVGIKKPRHWRMILFPFRLSFWLPETAKDQP